LANSATVSFSINILSHLVIYGAQLGRYTVPELLFIPSFHTGTCQYTLYPFIFSHLSDVISLFRSKKCIGTSTFPFRALVLLTVLIMIISCLLFFNGAGLAQSV
jgi:hypothetical protein